MYIVSSSSPPLPRPRIACSRRVREIRRPIARALETPTRTSFACSRVSTSAPLASRSASSHCKSFCSSFSLACSLVSIARRAASRSLARPLASVALSLATPSYAVRISPRPTDTAFRSASCALASAFNCASIVATVRARVELTSSHTRATDPHPLVAFIQSFIQSFNHSFIIIRPSIHSARARVARSVDRSIARVGRVGRVGGVHGSTETDPDRPEPKPKPKPKPKPTGTKGGSWVFFRRSRLIHDTQTRCATPTHVRDPFRRFIEREVDRGRRRVIRAVEGKEETEDDVTCPRETASWTSSRTRVWCIVRRRSLADARRRRLDRAREFAWIAREGGRGGRSVGRFARRLFARSSSSEEEESASRRE